jgi:hypothetical protein
MLTLATVTLFWVEAEEVWVEATAPVRTRTATNIRTIFFMEGTPWEISYKLLIIVSLLPELTR